MPEDKKISKREADIECIELDKKYFNGSPSKFQKIKNLFKLPRMPMRSRR